MGKRKERRKKKEERNKKKRRGKMREKNGTRETIQNKNARKYERKQLCQRLK